MKLLAMSVYGVITGANRNFSGWSDMKVIFQMKLMINSRFIVALLNIFKLEPEPNYK